MITANLAVTCKYLMHNWIYEMAGWVPIQFNGLGYYNREEGLDDETITFRLIWFTTHSMIGFLSLFSIMLEFFFLIDMILTWIHPIKYLSG